MNIFEQVSRKKLRFDVPGIGGRISTEDLWDLPLQGRGPNLDDIAKGIARQIRESEETSFVEEPSEAKSDLTLALDVVKHVIEAKKAKKAAAEQAAAIKAEKQKIAAILDRKRDSELESKSVEELEAMLKD